MGMIYCLSKWLKRFRILVRFMLYNLSIDKRPVFSVLTVTSHCNFRCKYCFGDYHKSQEKDLSTEKLLETVDELADLGIIYINVHGGEALLRKDMGKILTRAQKRHMFVNLITNGTFLKKFWDDVKVVDTFCISLDGREENNDLNRGPGTFKIASEAIDFILSRGHTPRIGMTISKHTIDDIEWLAEWAKERHIYIQPFLLFDQEHLPRELWLTREENHMALRKLIKLKKKGYPIFYSLKTLNYALDWPFDKPILRAGDMKDVKVPKDFKFIPCLYKILNIIVEANGTIRSCNAKIRGEYHTSILNKSLKDAKRKLLQMDDCLYCYHLPIVEFSNLMSVNLEPVFGQFINQAREDLKRLKNQLFAKCVASAGKPAVLFINPPGPEKLYRGMICTYISKANYIWQPFDFVTLSAHIPEKYDVKLIDCNIDTLSVQGCIEKIKKADPAAVIVSISSIVLEKDMEFLRQLRSAFPGLKISVLGDVMLEDSFCRKVRECGVDLILDPMDIDLCQYIETGRASSPNIVMFRDMRPEIHRKKEDKAKKVLIGIPRHKAFINSKYRVPFMRHSLYTTVSTQFSCPYKCHYCSCAKLPVTYRGYDEVLKELDFVKELGIREIYFSDPSFGYPKNNVKHLLHSMIDKKYSFSWSCYFNPAMGTDEMLKLMKTAGCHTVIIGVEDEDFDMLGSRFERRLSKEKLFEFTQNCKKLGIRICGDFIIGLNNKEEAFERIVDLSMRLDLDYASFNIYTPLMGSIVRDDMIRDGSISPDATGFDTTGASRMPDKKLIELRDKAVRSFYLRPSYIARRILSLKRPEEFFIQFAEMVELFKRSFAKR